MGTAPDDRLNFRLEDIDLPVLSSVAMEAMRLVTDGHTNASDIEKVIRVDQALAARILRLSNSPVFSGKSPTRSIRQAIARMGVRHLKAALFVAASSELFDRSDRYIGKFWSHGLASALASHWLSERLGIRDSDECFVAGLLHDVGKVLMYRQAGQAYGRLIDEAAHGGVRFYRHERANLQFCSHDALGALIAMKWELDQNTVEVIGNHHRVEDDEDIPQQTASVIALVSLASLVANHVGFGAKLSSTHDLLTSRPAEILRVKQETIEELVETLPAMVKEYDGLFS